MHERNIERAGWAETALGAFTAETFGGEAFMDLHPDDRKDAIGDLIGDLLHLCVREGLDPMERLANGQGAFEWENRPDYAGD